MPRRPAPYWKASHAAWYCTIAGVKYRLGTDQRDAEREFHRLMSAAGNSPAPQSLRVSQLIDWEACRATVDGKTGKRTISFPRSILTTMRRLAAQWPKGPILRNTLGQPWTRGALGTQMRRARVRAGVEHVVLYSARGHFGTEALRRGVDLMLVSKLLGHSTPSTTAKFYLEPDQPMLSEAVERATKKRQGS